MILYSVILIFNQNNWYSHYGIVFGIVYVVNIASLLFTLIPQ